MSTRIGLHFQNIVHYSLATAHTFSKFYGCNWVKQVMTIVMGHPQATMYVKQTTWGSSMIRINSFSNSSPGDIYKIITWNIVD